MKWLVPSGLLLLPWLAWAAAPAPKPAPKPDLDTLEYLADWPDADQPGTPPPDDPVLASIEALKALPPRNGEPHETSQTQR